MPVEELVLRALGHVDFLRATEDSKAPDLKLHLLEIDLLERLDRKATAAARIEGLLELAAQEKLKIDKDLLADLDARMAKLDSKNYPTAFVAHPREGPEAKRRDTCLSATSRASLRCFFAAGPSLARRRRRWTTRENCRVPPTGCALPRAMRDSYRAGSCGSRASAGRPFSPRPAREFTHGSGDLVAEMPALQAAEICSDVEVQGEYEVRATLKREGELYGSSAHGLVISGSAEEDWWIVSIDKEGRLIVTRLEQSEGGGTTARKVAIELLYPAFGS